MEKLEIWADGACLVNPGFGGWGAIVINEAGLRNEIYGSVSYTTNNQMEMQAVIEAFKLLSKPYEVTVYTDSQYVQKGMTEWIHGWKKRGWTRKGNEPVLNVDYWKELEAVSAKHKVKWVKVKGHAGIKENERADELASLGAKEAAEAFFSDD